MNIASIGLVLDIIGFILVFVYGGFDIGRSPALLVAKVPDRKYLKIIGATLIIAGFALQFWGSLR